jgi:hypothetical protein
MLSTGMLCHVALVKTAVSAERIASIIRVERIGELGTLGVTSNRSTASIVHSSPTLVSLMMEGIRSSETSVPTRATRRNIPDDGI